jgi:hypothetical protein
MILKTINVSTDNFKDLKKKIVQLQSIRILQPTGDFMYR